MFAESINMEANLEKELVEEEERCQAIKQMCKEEEKELRELDILGEELEVKFKGVFMTRLICYNYLADPGKARGCSTNTSSLINSFIQRTFSSHSFTAPPRPIG